MVPRCDVLFIYYTLDGQGRIVGRNESIRDLIKDAGSYVAVVASENDSGAYIAAFEGGNDWNANIALTTNRNGEWFGVFYRKLFESMFNGNSMLTSWVELAPQVAGS